MIGLFFVAHTLIKQANHIRPFKLDCAISASAERRILAADKKRHLLVSAQLPGAGVVPMRGKVKHYHRDGDAISGRFEVDGGEIVTISGTSGNIIYASVLTSATGEKIEHAGTCQLIEGAAPPKPASTSTI